MNLSFSIPSPPKRWLVTGVAGFIGSNLLEYLLRSGQTVVGLDNFSTGRRQNLVDVQQLVGAQAWENFTMIEGDIRELDVCAQACSQADIVLHQAALGSVPRSLDNPIATNASNIDGFLNMLVAARDSKIQRFVYAASSSTYGDHPELPKIEDRIGNPLSPYAVTKLVNELYAKVFGRCYGMSTIGLRYFNVFGRRQDPDGAYAAVIPKWFSSILKGEAVYINGDGQTSRDFCYVDNVVQANVRAAMVEDPAAQNRVYNVACGDSTSLNQLFELILGCLNAEGFSVGGAQPHYRDFRAGDIAHSLADISLARSLLGYSPLYSASQGLKEAAKYYISRG